MSVEGRSVGKFARYKSEILKRDSIVDKVFDGDFDSILRGANFNKPLRDYITIQDLIDYYNSKVNDDIGYITYDALKGSIFEDSVFGIMEE